MYKKSLHGLMAIAVGFAVHTQGEASSNGLPVAPGAASASSQPSPLTFAKEIHDFGKRAAGVTVVHDFVFTNISARNVVLNRVEPDCDCTKATNWTVLVEPGKTGIVPVQYQSRGYNGRIDQTVNVYCNGSLQPVAVLHVRGVLWQAIEVNPPQVVFNPGIEQKTNSTRSVRIRSWEGELLLTALPESTNKAFLAEVRTNVPGKDYYVDIRTTGKLSPGRLEAAITLKTSSTNLPVVTIPVSSTVATELTVTPAAVILPPGPLTKETTVKISLRNNYSSPVSVTNTVVNLNEVQVDTKEIRPGQLFYLIARFPAGFKLKTGQTAGMVIKTTSAEFPELRVPISQMQLSDSAH